MLICRSDLSEIHFRESRSSTGEHKEQQDVSFRIQYITEMAVGDLSALGLSTKPAWGYLMKAEG